MTEEQENIYLGKPIFEKILNPSEFSGADYANSTLRNCNDDPVRAIQDIISDSIISPEERSSALTFLAGLLQGRFPEYNILFPSFIRIDDITEDSEFYADISYEDSDSDDDYPEDIESIVSTTISSLNSKNKIKKISIIIETE